VTLTDAVASAQLVIEVAQTSRRRDLVIKPRLHAQAGVPEYWVVDLGQRELVVHTDPQGDHHRSVVVHPEGDTVSALRVPVSPAGPARPGPNLQRSG
jgi:Uma2 family endonuclease